MEVDNSNQPIQSLETPAPYPVNNQRGNYLIILSVVVLFLIVGGGAYYLSTQKTQQSSSIPAVTSEPSPSSYDQTNNSELVATSEPSPSSYNQINNSDWKTFTNKSAGVTLNYPSNWVTPENSFIAEKTFIPGEQDRSKTYNIIEIQKYQTQIYAEYTNSEWFNKINSLTAPMRDQREVRTKVISSTVASGEQYVVFTTEESTTAQSENSKQVKAYILKDQTIYQLTLDLYDQKGLDIFIKIVPTAVIN